MYTPAASLKPVPNQPVGIVNVKFNTFMRIGQFLNAEDISYIKSAPWRSTNFCLTLYSEPPPSVMHHFGLRCQHTLDTIYTCPTDRAQLTLTEFEAHCMEYYSMVACDSAFQSRLLDKTSKIHTNLSMKAMKHFKDVHLIPDGLECTMSCPTVVHTCNFVKYGVKPKYQYTQSTGRHSPLNGARRTLPVYGTLGAVTAWRTTIRTD
ncbi:hypothetical protein EDD18DRAFT_1112047 [Armillaria luteobubalina]|uniref:Uncharacterized protein n=1 Tax=Armillaria luteobubalina TaxID=153913 RepID=A0AA39PIB1_9AGAR|nr:hypothetical protein EDD18DRAFT_1112047 [Armillaria luteobubalina]